MSLTIPELPTELDAALRERAHAENKTLEQIALEALTAFSRKLPSTPKRDLSFFGDMSDLDAQALKEAHEFCDQIGMPAVESK